MMVDPAKTIIITCSIATTACIEGALAVGEVVVRLPAAVGFRVVVIALPIYQCTHYPEFCVAAAPPALPAPTALPLVVPKATPGAREILPTVVAPLRILPMVVAPQPSQYDLPHSEPGLPSIRNLLCDWCMRGNTCSDKALGLWCYHSTPSKMYGRHPDSYTLNFRFEEKSGVDSTLYALRMPPS